MKIHYVSLQECFTASLGGLADFQKAFPHHKRIHFINHITSHRITERMNEHYIAFHYVTLQECSTASLGGLADFHKAFPHHRTGEVKHALSRANDFLKSIQRADGSW
jgi:hypothetical protein